MDKLILIGAGGHSRSVVDSIDRTKYEICGFIDENKKGKHIGLPIFGSRIDDISDFVGYKYFVAIGDVYCRKVWFDKVKSMGLDLINIVDKTAIVSESVTIGSGNFIGKMAIINAGSKIGDNNVINTKALVEHECIIGNHNHLSTNSVINGNVIVESNVFVGSSAVFNGQLKIAHDSVIGSGSVVIRDIPANVTVVGNPARIIKRRENE